MTPHTKAAEIAAKMDGFDYWRNNPPREEQMTRWLGVIDGWAGIVFDALRELGQHKEMLRQIPERHTRLRAEHQKSIDAWQLIFEKYEPRLRSLQRQMVVCREAIEGRAVAHQLAGEKRDEI